VPYFQVTLPSSVESADILAAIVVELGSSGCEQRPESLIAFFPPGIDKGTVLAALEQHIATVRANGFEVPESPLLLEDVPDLDWNAEWKKRLKPFRISPHFTVKPSWRRLEKVKTQFVIELDPKQAFGTGSHATTRLMMGMLERYLEAGEAILDVGTGTAILAIAALKLGAQKAVAFDIDPLAVEAAVENRAVNVPDQKLALFTGTLSAIKAHEKYGLILANITRKTITALLPDLANHMKSDGLLLLSGILIVEAEDLKARLAAYALEVKDEEYLDEWCGLVVKGRVMP
jgi:ribosomal protein L11 methyltransferase